MKSIAYPEGWFYVERASVIMFGLQATLAPKLNGIQVGFPYIAQFLMERNAKRLSEQKQTEPSPIVKQAQADAKAAAAESDAEALLN